VKKNKKVWSFIDAIVFCLVVQFFAGCSQEQQKTALNNKPFTEINAPHVTLLSSLPDSLKAQRIFIPKAKRTIAVNGTRLPATTATNSSNKAQAGVSEFNGIGFFTNFTTDQGLPQDISNSTIVDKNGNIWFGTGSGVSRYDGKKFTTYTTAHGLANNYVTSIIEDKSGNFWFGTGGGGVSRYDGKRFINYTTAQGLPDNIINGIMQDQSGDLWFGTNKGLCRFDGKNFISYRNKPGFPQKQVQCIFEDKAGSFWFNSDRGGITHYDGKNFIDYNTEPGLASAFVTSIIKDHSGNLWFSTSGMGISRYDGKTFMNYTIKYNLASNSVFCMLQDKLGNLWFGTDHGLSKYDGKQFINYTTRQGLVNNNIYSIAEDSTGNIWIGTFGGGVSRFDGSSITNYTVAQGLPGNAGFAIGKDKEGNLLFGTTNGLSRYDGKGFLNYSTADGLVGDDIYDILRDTKGNLWFGTGGGISYFDGKHFINYTSADGLVAGQIVKIVEDNSGNIWIGSNGGGISCFDGKSFTNYSTRQGLASNIVHTITKDKSGNLWIGTSEGISYYDGKSFTNYTKKKGLSSNFILNINEDKFGNIWIGSDGGGISRFDGKSFISFNTNDGLPDNVISSVVIDSANNLFLGTNYGIGVLTSFKLKNGNSITAQNNLSNDELRNYIPEIEVYNSSTGYPIKDVNWGQDAMYIDSGVVWICTGSDKTALVRFDYSKIHKNKNAPRVIVQGIKVNNENIGWYDLLPESTRKEFQSDSNTSGPQITDEVSVLGKVLNETDRDSMRIKFDGIKFDSIAPFYPIPQNLVLPHKNNSVTIDFAAIEPDRPYLVKYQYILEGYDNAWNPVTDKTSATYGNIYEGTYTFKLKAQSPFGIWSEPISYRFKVLPPWWRTWWAYVLYFLVFLVVLGQFIRWRTGRLKKEKILLEEKVMVRTHELKEQKEKLENTLTELETTQSQLIQSEKMASLGELTAGIAHEIQNPLNFVNNFSEINKELITEMKEEISKGNYDEANALAKDVEENEEKINYHGKRADAIIKGMLQHSRTSTGQKELTDINALADEYLRLSYHGLRAKDKTFNAKFETDFDSAIGKINIVPQEIGRVILNLINNAFYAVGQRQASTGSASEPYEPTVTVSTSLIPPLGGRGSKVQIKVADNGGGIPQKIIDKIFQPFFTTKPTGQGTGLGLSMAYDIIKAHGGEIKVETLPAVGEGKPPGGTVFTILLPV